MRDEIQMLPQNRPAQVLCVYVSESCYVCRNTPESIERIKKRLPDLQIRIIDISKTEEEIPKSVFSVPTFVFNGKTISFGNPSDDAICKLVELARTA